MTALTTTDAFFVAYQEQRGVLMQFGVLVELAGRIERAQLVAAIARACERWPILDRTLVAQVGGLAWGGPRRDVIAYSGDAAAIDRWRTTPIDPFREPPFGVLWLERAADRHALAFRCHHAAADGELFFAIVSAVLDELANEAVGARDDDGIGARRSSAARGRSHPLALRALLRDTTLAASVREAAALARRARTDRSARLALRSLAPGPVAICDRRVARTPIAALATAERVRAPWLVAAAWLRALHAWNRARGVAEPRLTLEVPVSLRRGAVDGSGNHLAVLTLAADATLPRGDLARGLGRDYASGLRRRAHLAVPLLAQPARFLPWPMFRRIAVGSTTTGFATSHFTWLARDPDTRAAVGARSGGALAVLDQQIYTPVCLEMGAALCVLAWPDELQLAITYRETGLSAADAAELGDLLIANLT